MATADQHDDRVSAQDATAAPAGGTLMSQLGAVGRWANEHRWPAVVVGSGLLATLVLIAVFTRALVVSRDTATELANLKKALLLLDEGEYGQARPVAATIRARLRRSG